MNSDQLNDSMIPRRRFLQLSAATMGAISTGAGAEMQTSTKPKRSSRTNKSKYNREYSGERLNRVAFPMGGLGAGMICLEGTGALSHFSLRNKPEVFNEPCVFAAISIKGKPQVAKLVQQPSGIPDDPFMQEELVTEE